MSCLLQICSISAFIYWIDIANGIPMFQEISIHKDFEVKMKPFQFKPKAFLIEKWSPFGSFSFRKGIQKRDLGVVETLPSPPVVPPAPVFEHNEEVYIEERKDNIETPRTLRPGPDPVKTLSSNVIRVPLTENLKPATGGLYTSIDRNPSANNDNLEKPAQQNLEEFYGGLPPRPVGPVPAQQFNYIPVQPITPTPVQPLNQVVPLITPPPRPAVVPNEMVPLITPPPRPAVVPNEMVPLITPPARPAVVPNEMVPLITPPPRPAVAPNDPFSEVPPTDGPIVRGSKLALYFGNVFLQLISQFITNARLQLNQYSSQRTLPPVPVPTNA